MNDSRQRVHDNDYIAFAYSIKSPKQYEDWKDVVSELTHTSGFKKFSDMQIESFAGRPDNADEQEKVHMVMVVTDSPTPAAVVERRR